MNIKRIIALILAVFMVASLAACGGAKSANLTAAVNSEGDFIYNLVRSGETTSTEVNDAVKSIRSAVKKNFGCPIVAIKDTVFEDYDGNLEILIGDTNREESAIAKQRLMDNRINNGKDFIVAVINDKVCIQVTDYSTLSYAAEWFIKNFCQSFETFERLRTDYEFIYEHNYSVSINSNTVNDVELSRFTVVLPVSISYLSGMYADEYIEFYTQVGCAIKKVEDIDPEETYEILIGDCNREASKTVTAEGDNYIVKVSGNKIVIKGGNDLATSRGVKAFIDEVKKAKEGKGFVWSDGYTLNGKYDATEEGAYTLNWHDEFDSNTVDLSKWGDYGSNSDAVEPSSLGGVKYWIDVHGETAYTAGGLKKLIYQSDGNMVLACQRANEIDFVGGQISTYFTMLFRYGLIEIRSKHAPTPANVGYWCNGANMQTKRFGVEQGRYCMTEIDMLENFGSNLQFHSNVHRWWAKYDTSGKQLGSEHNSLDGSAVYSGNSLNNKKKVYDTERYGDVLSDNYHIYSCYWDDSSLKFGFDGKIHLDYQFEDNMSVAVHCLMNYFNTECHMGDTAYGVVYDKDIHEDYYEHKLDYVRIYQSDLYNSQLITAWPEKQETGTLNIMYPDHPINGAY
ncbi:MAG: family 16 glycosylhydrolase [Acutalibacteraceae bacterium]|nr:family 16 glycosylhydrolase [Acutalibacteraceae bacterium]